MVKGTLRHHTVKVFTQNKERLGQSKINLALVNDVFELVAEMISRFLSQLLLAFQVLSSSC